MSSVAFNFFCQLCSRTNNDAELGGILQHDLPMSLRGSTTSHFGSDLKNMDTCCKAISTMKEREIRSIHT